MEQNKAAEQFRLASELLPHSLREAALGLLTRDRERAEELRLRAGQQPSIVLPEGELFFRREPVTAGELERVVEIASQASPYAVKSSLSQGYLTARGGFRLGLCGECILQNGEPAGFRSLSGICLRIAREHPGAADGVAERVRLAGPGAGVLIVSPPGGGKTTLLRDLVRQLSTGDRERGILPLRVGLADERGEVAGLYGGIPQLDVGKQTDVLEGCPKARGVMLLLRVMNPQVIALDEITDPEDARAILQAAGCGAGILATAHGDSPRELAEKPLFRSLFSRRAFSLTVTIRREGDRRIPILEEAPPC